MLKLRSVTREDCTLLWEWANDADVRSASFESGPIPWKEHVSWFDGKRSDPHCCMYIVEGQSGCPVGQVRFELEPKGSAEINISIARDHRGCGYGAQALRVACAELFRTANVTEVVAHVKPENVASIRAFEKAGFVHRATESVKGCEAVRMSLRGNRDAT